MLSPLADATWVVGFAGVYDHGDNSDWHRERDLFAVGSTDGVLWTLDMEEEGEEPRRWVLGRETVERVAWCDGTTLVAASRTALWTLDVESGAQRSAPMVLLGGLANLMCSESLSAAVVMDRLGSVWRWDLETLEPTPVLRVELTADAAVIAPVPMEKFTTPEVVLSADGGEVLIRAQQAASQDIFRLDLNSGALVFVASFPKYGSLEAMQIDAQRHVHIITLDPYTRHVWTSPGEEGHREERIAVDVDAGRVEGFWPGGTNVMFRDDATGVYSEVGGDGRFDVYASYGLSSMGRRCALVDTRERNRVLCQDGRTFVASPKDFSSHPHMYSRDGERWWLGRKILSVWDTRSMEPVEVALTPGEGFDTRIEALAGLGEDSVLVFGREFVANMGEDSRDTRWVVEGNTGESLTNGGAVNPSERWAIFGGYSGFVTLLDVKTGEELARHPFGDEVFWFEVRPERCSGVVIRVSGESAGCVNDDGTEVTIIPAREAILGVQVAREHDEFLARGPRAASWGTDGRVFSLWEDGTLSVLDPSLDPSRVAWSEDGAKLLVVSQNGALQRFDEETVKASRSQPLVRTPLADGVDLPYTSAAQSEGLELESGGVVKHGDIRVKTLLEAPVVTAALSPGGAYLGVHGMEGFLYLYDAKTGALLQHFPVPGEPVGQGNAVLLFDADALYAAFDWYQGSMVYRIDLEERHARYGQFLEFRGVEALSTDGATLVVEGRSRVELSAQLGFPWAE